MTSLRVVAATCFTALFSSLLLARVHPFGNAGLYEARSSSASIMEHSSVPPGAREVLITKCADCHSTVTRTPLYGRLAPISWLLERDILEGRKHMNLSAWDSYTPDQQQVLEAKIIQQARAGTMPLPQYRIIHRNSVLTATDIDILSQWTHQASAPETSSHRLSPGSAAAGKDVFERRCTGCHALDQNREGPKMRGVYGRTSGQLDGFPYSPALKNAHIIWDDATLDRWLTDPDAFVSGNNMDFRVTKQQERQDLIRFLKESARTDAASAPARSLTP